jgi:hypothetical protein
MKAFTEHCAETERLYKAVNDACPPLEALRVLTTDKEFGFHPPSPDLTGHYGPADMFQFAGDRRETIIEHTPTRLLVDRGDAWSPKKCARADQIVDAYNEWRERYDAACDDLGYLDTDDDADEALRLVHELELEIAKTPATNLVEAIAQARAAAEILAHYHEISGSDPQVQIAISAVEAIARFASSSGGLSIETGAAARCHSRAVF